MEDITAIRVSDLQALHAAIIELRSEIKELKEIEKEAKAYTIQETAKMLGLHYCTIRKFTIKGTLFAKYVDGKSGKCIIPLWSIIDYLKSTKNSNQ